MTFQYIFLLGRPGCGKSAVYHALENRILASGQAILCQRMDDFPILWARYQHDADLEKAGQERIYFTRIDDESCLPKSGLFDEILQELNALNNDVHGKEHLNQQVEALFQALF